MDLSRVEARLIGGLAVCLSWALLLAACGESSPPVEVGTDTGETADTDPAVVPGPDRSSPLPEIPDLDDPIQRMRENGNKPNSPIGKLCWLVDEIASVWFSHTMADEEVADLLEIEPPTETAAEARNGLLESQIAKDVRSGEGLSSGSAQFAAALLAEFEAWPDKEMSDMEALPGISEFAEEAAESGDCDPL